VKILVSLMSFDFHLKDNILGKLVF